jgi:polar amino acid transport system permease protein
MIEMTPWDIIRNLLLATRWTILLSLTAFAGGIVLSVLLLPLRTAKAGPIRIVARLYVNLFQGSPLLIQLFVIFFGLPLIGLRPTAWTAAAVGMTLWSAAFFVEIWKGSVESIVRGQWEASASLGMSYFQQMRHVVLPQAIPISIAPTVGFMVQIVKGTALTSIIGFVDLSRAGGIITNSTFEPFTVYGLVAIIYFCLCWPLSYGSKLLERKLGGPHLDH